MMERLEAKDFDYVPEPSHMPDIFCCSRETWEWLKRQTVLRITAETVEESNGE